MAAILGSCHALLLSMNKPREQAAQGGYADARTWCAGL
jgi:hypothetical protein